MGAGIQVRYRELSHWFAIGAGTLADPRKGAPCRRGALEKEWGIRVSSVARRHGFRQGKSTNRAMDVGRSLRDRTGLPPEENA